MDVIVRRGDSLWSYSQWFRLPLQLVVDSNRGVNPAGLAAGQTIRIPGYTAEEYRVREGDSFWRISRERGYAPEVLMLLNPGVDPNRLTIGQRLIVPLRVTWRVVSGAVVYGSARLAQDLDRLLAVYPFVRSRTIGASVLNIGLTELRIGNGAKRIHCNGSFHANEWITTPILMTVLNDYLLAVTNETPFQGLPAGSYYDQVDVSVVPMVNPDGVNLVVQGLPETEPYSSRVLEINGGSTDFSNWKANIRSVDLNDQFPARWELEAASRTKRPAPRDYPGTAPLTEPEAVAMADLSRSSDFHRVYAFHTQGSVIYWGFENLEPPESETIVGELARVSGYEPVRGAGSYAGYKDWFIQDWRRPGFTVELGLGVNPLPLSQFERISREASAIFASALVM